MNILKIGDRGPEVITLQELLSSQGFLIGEVDGLFGLKTEESVISFQSSHLGQEGKYLEVDGEVGPNTWWALENATGDGQRSFLDPIIPKGLTPVRKEVVSIAVDQYRSNVREVPNGRIIGWKFTTQTVVVDNEIVVGITPWVHIQPNGWINANYLKKI